MALTRHDRGPSSKNIRRGARHRGMDIAGTSSAAVSRDPLEARDFQEETSAGTIARTGGPVARHGRLAPVRFATLLLTETDSISGAA